VTYLVDTNVLLRFAQQSDPLHLMIRAAVRKLRVDGHSLRAASQNFVEFWNAGTRPAIYNGMGWTQAEADRWLRLVEHMFQLFPDTSAIYPEWRRLIIQFGVSGAKVHDARLVATMIAHTTTHILTLNTADFTRYASIGIVAVDPHTV